MSTKIQDRATSQPHARAQSSRVHARFALAVLLLINILNYADRYVLPAVLPKIRTDLGLTPLQEGLLGSSFLLVYAFATLPLGLWADRGKRKNIIALCVGVWSVATVLAGFTRNFLQLFSVRAVLGIGEAGYGPASLSLLGDHFPKRVRGRVLSFWSAGTLLGAAIGFTIGGLIADTLGWRWAFYVVGIPGLITAFLSWRMLEPPRGASEREGSAQDIQDQENIAETTHPAHGSIDKDFWRTVRKVSRIRTYWVLVGALIFSFFTIGGTSFWLPSYCVDTFKLTLAKAGLLSGIVLVSSGLVGTLVGGWLADFMQRRRPDGRLMVAAFGFLMGAPLAFIALLLHSLVFFVATFILAGIFLNFCTGPLNAVIQDVIRPEIRATALGLSLLLAHLLGDAAAPFIMGSIASGSSLFVAMITTAPTFLLLAGLVCLLGLRWVARDMQQMQEQL